MKELYYNFIIEGSNRGFTYLRIDDNALFSHTHFILPNEVVITNIFNLKLNEGKIISCKHNDLEEVTMSNLPKDHYPGCAYPLFIENLKESEYSYTQISEDDGTPTGVYTLSKEGKDIVEKCCDRESRRFTLENNIINRIDWGGAISEICPGPSSAIEGSKVNFNVQKCKK